MTSVFLGIKRRKFNKKDVHKHTSLLRFRRFNISLASCSAAELVSVSVEHCKNQSFKLYLQTVKKVSHVQVYIDYKLVNYLEERYPSFVITDYDDKESMSISVASFLFKLNCRELRTLYIKFATKKDAIDDLMVYKNKDRCRFIARCWKWEVSHVELIDMIIAN